jgi:hypothetical protein
MQTLMARLGFSEIKVEGLHPLRAEREGDFGTSRFAGLLVTASGFGAAHSS